MRTCSIQGLSSPFTTISLMLTAMERWYAEDCSRLPGLDVLKDVGKTFAASIVGYKCIFPRLIFTVVLQSRLPVILDSSPVDARIQGWKTKTQREFDPLEDAGQQSSKTILCPKCRNPVDASQWIVRSCWFQRLTMAQVLMTDEGTGYFQEKFTVNCGYAGCKSRPITKITLAARKLAEDLVRNDATPRSCLA